MSYSDDAEATALTASMVGRTITEASVMDGESGPLELSLTLDDGRTIEVEGWGHDWWGLNIREANR